MATQWTGVPQITKNKSSVIASEFSILSCILQRGLANRILNRDLHLEDDVISNDVNEVINMYTSPAAAAARQLERETNNWGSALQYFGINY